MRVTANCTTSHHSYIILLHVNKYIYVVKANKDIILLQLWRSPTRVIVNEKKITMIVAVNQNPLPLGAVIVDPATHAAKVRVHSLVKC